MVCSSKKTCSVPLYWLIVFPHVQWTVVRTVSEPATPHGLPTLLILVHSSRALVYEYSDSAGGHGRSRVVRRLLTIDYFFSAQKATRILGSMTSWNHVQIPLLGSRMWFCDNPTIDYSFFPTFRQAILDSLQSIRRLLPTILLVYEGVCDVLNHNGAVFSCQRSGDMLSYGMLRQDLDVATSHLIR